MQTTAGVTTQTNNKGVLTKITVDLKKHPEAIKALSEIGLISKSTEDLEREAFYKKVNNPANWSPEAARQSSLNKVRELWKTK